MALRYSKFSRGIFNSLLDLAGFDFKGSRPSEPSAIAALGADRIRCVNYGDCWEKPSDLTSPSTWLYFRELRKRFGLRLDLMLFDMENRDDQSRSIEELLSAHLSHLLESGGTVIFKTYCHRLLEGRNDGLIFKIAKHFKEVHLCQTAFTSSFSSEVYVVFLKYSSGYSRACHIDTGGLLKFIKSCYVFASPEKELDRACSLKNLSLDDGVPPELLPNKEVELATVLEISGVESGRAAELANLMVRLDSDIETKRLGLLYVPLNSVFKLTAFHLQKPAPLSDTKLVKFMSYIIGVEFWWCWVHKDLNRFKILNSMIKDDVLVTQQFIETPNGWITALYIGKIHAGITKRVRLRGQMASIGTAIRAICRSVGFKSSGRAIKVTTLLGRFDSALSPRLISDRTNIKSYCYSYQPPTNQAVASDITNSSREVACSLFD